MLEGGGINMDNSFIPALTWLGILFCISQSAMFSRNALKMAALFAPVIRFYQYFLYPFTKPSAKSSKVRMAAG